VEIFLNTRKRAMAQGHAWRQNAPVDSRTRHTRLAGRVDLVYLVCFVHLVSLVQPNKRDETNQTNQSNQPVYAQRSVALAGFFNMLLERADIALDMDKTA
jgi:hypothetical protein